MSYQEREDEIDLTELLQQLWLGKWLIIAAASVAAIFSLIYLALSPASFQGQLEIKPLSSFEKQKYDALKETSLYQLSPHHLEIMLIEDLERYQTFEENVLALNYVAAKNPTETNAKFSKRTQQAARMFTITKPGEKHPDPRVNWLINFNTHQPDLASQVLNAALKQSTINVKNQIETAFNTAIEAYARNIDRQIEDIAINRLHALKQQQMATNSRVAFLKEQAQLARALKIENSTLNTQTFNTQSAVVTTLGAEEPFYYRGYVAIETELELLLARQFPSLFLNEIIALEKKKQTLVDDPSIERAIDAFSRTPITSDNFSAASYDINSIELKRSRSSALILLMAVMLGGFLGVLILLIKNAVTAKANKQPV